MSVHGGRRRGTWIGLRGMQDGDRPWGLGVSRRLWAPSVGGTEEETDMGAPDGRWEYGSHSL